jgi:YHS domain-containing protein
MALIDLLLLVLAMLMARAAWRVIDGVREGLAGRGARAGDRAGDRHVPARGIQMVRDPVCGTYVIPDRALALSDGSGRIFFCSASCRDKYRARTA